MIEEHTNGRNDGRMDGWTDGRMYRRTDICTSRHPIDQVLILYLSEIKEKLRNNIISEIGQINCRKCAFLLIVELIKIFRGINRKETRTCCW